MSFIEAHEFLKEYCDSQGLDEQQAMELDTKVYNPWTLKELPMMEPWLKQNGPVIDLIAEAVRKPVFCLPIVHTNPQQGLVEEFNLDNLVRTRDFARMLQTRAQYCVGTGDVEGAIDDILTCQRLGHHLEGQGTLISRLVGIAFRGMAASVGIAANPESQPTQQQLQRFAQALNSLPAHPTAERTWMFERYLSLDLLQKLAVRRDSLAGIFRLWDSVALVDGEGSVRPGPAVARHISVDWNIVMREVNRYFDSMNDMDDLRTYRRPSLVAPGDLLLSSRSRRVAEVMAGLTTPAFRAAREAVRRSDCAHHLQRIALAMLIYQHEHGTLPPAYTVDASGNPLHSWRVELLPYLGEEELYDDLHLDEPWDSEHNRQYHQAAPDSFCCPSAGLEPGQTCYSVVVGETTPFQAGTGKSLDRFGMHLMLVVERKQSVCWMDPTSELSEATAGQGIDRQPDNNAGMGSLHPGGINAAWRDGSALFVTGTIETLKLQRLVDGTAKERP